MQCAVIEFARNVAGLKGAHSAEFSSSTPYPVIDLMEEQKGVEEKGGTMRLGAYPCVLKEGTFSYEAYGRKEISERHRHRYEFNNRFRETLEKAGLVIAGTSEAVLKVESEARELSEQLMLDAVMFGHEQAQGSIGAVIELIHIPN